MPAFSLCAAMKQSSGGGANGEAFDRADMARRDGLPRFARHDGGIERALFRAVQV
jgi:hypothetical protein